MKQLIILVILFIATNHIAKAQDTTSPGMKTAQHIAEKMAQELGLTPPQKVKIADINRTLVRKKMEAMGRTQDKGSIGPDIQKIENSRDSLYQQVMTDEQFLIYKDRKSALINRN
jgi:Spy/CpxP family protein refolding chaperone